MRSTILIGLALAIAPAAAPTAAGAQTALPGLENFTLERPQPPRPTATQTPTPVPSATPSAPATAVPVPPPAVLPSAAPTATPTPRPAATSTRVPVAAPTSATPAAAPSSAPVAIPSAVLPESAAPTPTTTADTMPAAAPGGANWPLWLTIAAVVAALAAAGWWWRRRQSAAAADAELWEVPPEPAKAPPAPPPAPVVPAAPAAPKRPGGLITTALRPDIVFDLRPAVAGIDALRASVDFELAVANIGRAEAYEVTVETWLIGAGSDPRAELAPLFAQPPGEPLLPPFTLPSSANADLAAQTVVSRDVLPTITAGERKLFVPLVAVRATWRDGRGQPATATAAFLIGAAPAGQERLAPLALDRGTRTYRTLAARRLEG